MYTIAFASFPKDEQDIFRSSCRRWHKKPGDFVVTATEVDLPADPPTRKQRDIIVSYVPSGKGRSYRARCGLDWIGEFEDDLQLVYFGRNPPAATAVSSPA